MSILFIIDYCMVYYCTATTLRHSDFLQTTINTQKCMRFIGKYYISVHYCSHKVFRTKRTVKAFYARI